MKRAAAAAIAAALSLLVAVAAAEIVLRASITKLPLPFLIYLSPELKNQSPRTWERIRAQIPLLNARQEDPDVGWTNRPNLHKSGLNEEGEPYDATASAEGFFTPDVPDASTKQLITLGASFLCTFYVRHPIQNVLRDALGVPVYNVAAGEWGPESYRAAYLKFAAARRHDLVVVFTVPSDPSNVVNWREWKAEASSESFMKWMQNASAENGSVNRGASWPDNHLMFWNLLKFVANHPPSSLAQAEASGPNASRLEHFGSGTTSFDLQLGLKQIFTENDPDYFLPGSSYYQVMQEYFESLLRLKAAIEARHARMVLVWLPSKERVYIPALPAARRAAYITNHTGDISGLENALAKFAKLAGVSYLDLTEPLVERARHDEKMFFTADGHWNSSGNEVAGALVADFIRNLPERPPVAEAVNPPLFLRTEAVHVERPLTSSSINYRAGIVHDAGAGWSVHGRAEGRFSYLARWNETSVDKPQWLVATGVVRRGGLTIGVLLNDKWAGQLNVSHRGHFDLALPVAGPGRYIVLVANQLPGDSLENDADITSLGWAPIR
jgi:hypothetical protein